MTTLMKKAIHRLQQVPPTEQDTVAQDILEGLEADRKWGEAFAATTEAQWTKLREAVDEEVAQGKTMSGDGFLAQHDL